MHQKANMIITTISKIIKIHKNCSNKLHNSSKLPRFNHCDGNHLKKSFESDHETNKENCCLRLRLRWKTFINVCVSNEGFSNSDWNFQNGFLWSGSPDRTDALIKLLWDSVYLEQPRFYTSIYDMDTDYSQNKYLFKARIRYKIDTVRK